MSLKSEWKLDSELDAVDLLSSRHMGMYTLSDTEMLMIGTRQIQYGHF